MRAHLLEETGIEIEEVKDLDKLTEIFSAIKVNHSDIAPYGVVRSDITATESNRF